jgi:hypothetical protein
MIQWWTPPLRLQSQIVALSLWCDVPSMAVFFVENLFNVVLILFPDFLNLYIQFP